MKKVSFLLVLIIVLMLVLVSCGTDYTWDDALVDIDKLKEVGFETEYIDEPKELVAYHGPLEEFVEVKHMCAMVFDDGTAESSVLFAEFSNKTQAKMVYYVYKRTISDVVFVRFGAIIIVTDSDVAKEILGYKFENSLVK